MNSLATNECEFKGHAIIARARGGEGPGEPGNEATNEFSLLFQRSLSNA